MSTRIDHNNIDLLLNEIGKRLFQVKELTDGDSMDTVLLWDSMGHVELMIAIEKTFNISVRPEDIFELTSIGAVKQYLEKHI